MMKQRLRDQYMQKWRESLNNTSKLFFYCKFKTDVLPTGNVCSSPIFEPVGFGVGVVIELLLYKLLHQLFLYVQAYTSFVSIVLLYSAEIWTSVIVMSVWK